MSRCFYGDLALDFEVGRLRCVNLEQSITE